MRLLGWGVVLVWGLAMGLTAGVQAWAKTAEPSPAVTVFFPDTPSADCPSPCWGGINTYETPYEATAERFMALPNAQKTGLVEWRFGADHAQRIRLERGLDLLFFPSGLQVGDLIATLGQPDYQVRGSAYGQRTPYNAYYLSLFYADYGVVFTVLVDVDDHLTPLSRVFRVWYVAGAFPEPQSRHPWQGYAWMPTYTYFGYAQPLPIQAPPP